jgi:hypothetical protein
VIDVNQNHFYETLTGIALHGQGYFPWNEVPIGSADDAARDAGLQIARPQAALNREARAVLERTRSLTSAEPHVATTEYEEDAPLNPYHAPARVMSATRGRSLEERRFHPRTDTGRLAGLSLNPEARDAAVLKLFDRLIAKRKKFRKDQMAAIARNKRQQDDRDDGEIEQHGRTRVAGDRSAAFDTVELMPLSEENLYTWQAWFPTKLPVTGAAQKHFSNLRTFLRREGLHQKKFRELDWREKVVLERLVEKIVGAAA